MNKLGKVIITLNTTIEMIRIQCITLINNKTITQANQCTDYNRKQN